MTQPGAGPAITQPGAEPVDTADRRWETEGPRVLIVDDEPDQLGLLTTYFTRAGCTVLAMSNAEQAMALPPGMQLDLMVLDLLLPRINGWELTAHLREQYPGCPVAITSILDVEHYPQQAEAVLPKPVTRAHVRDLLAENVPGWISR